MLNMFLQLIIVLGVFPRMVARVYYPTPSVEDCSDSYCLFLYRWEMDGFRQTWRTANRSCNDRGMFLVSVLNRDVQSRVESLIQSAMKSEDIDKVWIGARQNKSSAAWRYLDGRTMERNIQDMLKPRNTLFRNCVYIRCTQPSVKYITYYCTAENGHHRTVCQFPVSVEHDATDNNDTSFNYEVYNETDDDDWFAARSHCHDDGGDLIHTSNLDDAQMSQICSSVGHNQTFWFGITRYPWKWQTLDGRGNILYSNWIPNILNLDYTDRCAYSDAVNNDQWGQASCTVWMTHYFICMNGSIPEEKPVTMVTTPVTSAEDTSTPPTVSTQHTSSDARRDSTVSTTDGEEEGGFELYYIAVIVVGVLILLTVPGIILFLRKRKQIPLESSHNPVVDVAQNDGLVVTEEPRYISYEGSHNPAAAVAQASGDPSGNNTNNLAAFYNRTEEAVNVYDTAESWENNKDPMNNPTRKCSNDIYDLAGDPDNVNTATPHVRTAGGDIYTVSLNDRRVLHTVTEQGDEYALPVINKQQM